MIFYERNLYKKKKKKPKLHHFWASMANHLTFMVMISQQILNHVNLRTCVLFNFFINEVVYQ